MAKTTFKIQGLQEVELNLNKAISSIKGNVKDGIAAAGQFIKGESQELTSIKEGNLIRSAFSKEVGTDKDPAVAVGYTADYAAAVHEMPKNTKWNRPGAENEFLEKAVTRNITSILNIITRFSGKKPL